MERRRSFTSWSVLTLSLGIVLLCSQLGIGHVCSAEYILGLTLGSHESIAFDDGTICFGGLLVVPGRSRLLTRDTTLRFDLSKTPTDEALWINDNASWEATSTAITSSTGQSVVIRCTGNSVTYLSEVPSVPGQGPPVFYVDHEALLSVEGSTVGNVFIDAGDSTVELIGSEVGGLLLGLEEGAHYVFDGLHSGLIRSWSCDDCHSVVVEDSRVAFWGLLFSSRVGGLAVRNSNIAHIEWELDSRTAELSDLRPRLYHSFEQDGFSLQNTDIGSWTVLVPPSAELTISESDLRVILTEGRSNVLVSDSRLWDLWCLGFRGELVLDETVFVEEMRFVRSEFLLAGQFRCASDVAVRWSESSVTRCISVQVMDEAGIEVGGAGILVFDPDGVFHTMAVLDVDGSCELCLRFDDSTFNRDWTIEAPLLGLSKSVTFLEHSPIVLESIAESTHEAGGS